MRVHSATLGLFLVTCTLLLAAPAEAIPYFARKYDVGCGSCHSVVPKLNTTGLAFRANGYSLPGFTARQTLAVAAWVSGRYENRPDADTSGTVLDKVELISGGRLGSRVSYFAEWRAVSLDLQDGGGRSDRSGRFEDLFVGLAISDSLTLTAGQFRHFNQFDVSLRLSASTPLALGGSVSGERQPGDTDRQASLRRFSPAGRSPSAMLTYHAPTGGGINSADGWYAHAAVPFPGEFSIPLTAEARDRASFEFDTRAKGVVLESYYRHGLSSIGGHAYLGRDSKLYTGLFSLDPGRWNTTFAIGSGVANGVSDHRLSWWTEYQPAAGLNLGYRLDDSSFSTIAHHLYADYQIFSHRGVLWFLVEQRFADGADRTILALNGVF